MTPGPPALIILDGSVAVTGAFISAREIARAYRGDADVFLVLPEGARIDDRELGDFGAVYYLPIRPLRRRVGAILFYLPTLLRATWGLRRLILRHRGAVLIANDVYLVHGPLLRLFRHRGIILTWVRIDPAAFGRMGGIWLRISDSLSNKIVAVSRHVQGLLPAGMASCLLYNALSEEFAGAVVPRGASGLVFVLTGNYIEGKGQDIALEAFARLLPEVPEARLLFHGGDMGLERNRVYLRALEAQASCLGIAHAVTFGGFLADPREVLIGAFAALNLSRSESFSRTVLEASACGLPVIATRSGGPAEIIVDGETGILIPIDDVGACVSAMRELCDDPSRAARMGAAGRARVLSTFSPSAFASALRRLIP